jgi:ABC-2 type transport system ATP-binding protein
MDEAEVLCDRVAIMDAGRILALDAPAALVRGLEAATRVALPSGVLGLDTARALPGAESALETSGELVLSTREPARLVAALAERQALDGISVRTATLEDVFLTLTGREYRA